MCKDQYLGRSILSKDSDKVSLQDDVWVSEQASLAEGRDSRPRLNALVTDYVILRYLSHSDCHCNANISCLY